jgi:hypothetical protein
MTRVIGLQMSEEHRKVSWLQMLVNKAKYEHFRKSSDSWDLRVANRSKDRFRAHLEAYVA